MVSIQVTIVSVAVPCSPNMHAGTDEPSGYTRWKSLPSLPSRLPAWYVQVVERLGGVLPVWLEADGWEEPAEALDDIFLGDAELWWVVTCG